jgi:hypothetical protein
MPTCPTSKDEEPRKQVYYQVQDQKEERYAFHPIFLIQTIALGLNRRKNQEAGIHNY